MIHDLSEAHRLWLSGQVSATGLMAGSLDAAASSACTFAFVSTSFEGARSAAHQADQHRKLGIVAGPLAGLAVSVKDLFDVTGEVSRAGSAVLAGAPAARADAPAVRRLREAGAAFVGRSNMSEFAFSGVGINPHFGTPANAAAAAVGGVTRIPGGSSSGGAVSVAAGAAWAALGSDTGGSLRIPAALQGIVGFKGTARRVPTAGAIPLSTTLDTVGAMTRSVRDAVVLHEVLSATTIAVASRPLSAMRFAVPSTVMLDGLEGAVATAFDRALSRLSEAGARIERVALPLLGEATVINAGGGFAPAEAWAYHRRRMAEHEAAYDPRVAQRIRRGAAMSAADYIDLLHARSSWIAAMEAAIAPYDALLSPTVPVLAPPLAPLLGDDAAFFAVNAALLRNPSCVNLLDGCALSLPCQAEGELPVGLMVWGGAMRDETVLHASLAIEAALAGSRALAA